MCLESQYEQGETENTTSLERCKRGKSRSSLGKHLFQEAKDFRNVQLNVF